MRKTVFFLFVCLSGTLVLAQQSVWKSNQNGWVTRKKPQSSQFEKFFAIGLWNMPGYTANAMESDPETYRVNALQYLNNTSLYNIVYMSPGNIKDKYERVEITGSVGFYETLKEYQKNIPGIAESADSDYAQRQYIKNNVDDKDFVNKLDSLINHTIKLNGPVDYIWAPIDEIVNGGGGSAWCWHPEVGEKIKERIKKQAKNTLVYTDLVGIGRGNTYLFERDYLKKNKFMPEKPPYDALGKDAKIMLERPLLGFYRSYDGKPVYKEGTPYYEEYNLETLKTMFFENLKQCAKDYKGCGDVFGINAFIDFNTYPILSGVTVDAIKAGAGANTPIWFFFDGNGYAKPTGMSVDDFVKLLKCQIYTSVIHGATGVLFWNDRSKSPEVFNTLDSVVKELTENLDIIYMETQETKFEEDLHYMIKKDKQKRYLIASNTSKTETQKLNIPNVSKKSFQPLEVFISSF